MREIPCVSVAIITYNHEKYIRQCLESIVRQIGDFRLEVSVFDDASSDGTLERVREFLAETTLAPNVSVTLRPSESNLGMVKNLERIVRSCAESTNEFATILDGDDFWVSPYRVQKHIDFLRGHPDCPFSFNAFLRYSEPEEKWELFSHQTEYPLDLLPAEFLAQDNIIGNMGCSFFRSIELRDLPEGLFSLFCGDWFLHLAVARGREIGFLHEPLSVYRSNPEGIWAGEDTEQKNEAILKLIDQFDRVTQGRYHSGLERFRQRSFPERVVEPFRKKVPLCIVDDVFPHKGSSFRMAEFCEYLKTWPDMKILCTGESLRILGKESLRTVCRTFAEEHPEWSGQILWDDELPEFFQPEFAYFCFLGNVFPSIPFLEKHEIPFAFELYPGGMFARNDERSDSQLRVVLSSPCFRKVITTQPATTRYLLENHFCREDQIEEIFGVVTPGDALRPYELPKRRYGFEKDRLDIVFAAFRYTPDGADKGYDVFVEMAKLLHRTHENVYFHVVGGFDEKVLDVSELGDHIRFYGAHRGAWFDTFYQDKDAIVSPNVPDVLAPGAFDGFPTASCTEAALRDVALFVTDPLDMNEGRFAPGEEIEIIPHDAQVVARLFEEYLRDPERLSALARGSAAAVRRIYSADRQIRPRVELLRREMERARQDREKIRTELSRGGRAQSVEYQVFGTNGQGESRLLKTGWGMRRSKIHLSTSFQEQDRDIREVNFKLFGEQGVLLRAVTVEFDGMQIPVKAHNGVELEDRIYFASEMLPQIICELPEKTDPAGKRMTLSADAILAQKSPDGVLWELKQALIREQQRTAECQKCTPADGHPVCKLYFSVNRRFDEQHAVEAVMLPVADSCNAVTFDLPTPENGGWRYVRFDPVEGRLIQVEILRAQCDRVPIKCVRTNGKKRSGRTRFENTDPWFEFQLPRSGVHPKRITFLFEMDG